MRKFYSFLVFVVVFCHLTQVIYGASVGVNSDGVFESKKETEPKELTAIKTLSMFHFPKVPEFPKISSRPFGGKNPHHSSSNHGSSHNNQNNQNQNQPSSNNQQQQQPNKQPANNQQSNNQQTQQQTQTYTPVSYVAPVPDSPVDEDETAPPADDANTIEYNIILESQPDQISIESDQQSSSSNEEGDDNDDSSKVSVSPEKIQSNADFPPLEMPFQVMQILNALGNGGSLVQASKPEKDGCGQVTANAIGYASANDSQVNASVNNTISLQANTVTITNSAHASASSATDGAAFAQATLSSNCFQGLGYNSGGWNNGWIKL